MLFKEIRFIFEIVLFETEVGGGRGVELALTIQLSGFSFF